MSSETADLIDVEVAYARPDAQRILSVRLARGATVEDAIKMSGILRQFAEIDLTVNKVGIFGKLSGLDTPLKAGDRVEIYRALIADPKEVRKRRAAQGKPDKKGGGAVKPGFTKAAEQ
jgi:putative ubiquitin-RnfH superfamily antitoxin RatB of RatAB toxin-antitoxin module